LVQVTTLGLVDEDRSREINSVILKGVGLLVGLGVVIAFGTYVVVHALGLNDPGETTTSLGAPVSVSPLPTTALPEPDPSTPASPGLSDSTPARTGDALPRGARGLHLTMTPLVASPMERLNVTGTYPRHDNVALQVQRFENGIWADFPTNAQVSMGTFETYVMTSRVGVNRFRVFDPATGKASNVVSVSIG
jgi:hypothetical protein